MTEKSYSERRKDLLITLERMLGRQCHGSSRATAIEGFRYPVTVEHSDGTARKFRNVPRDTSDERLMRAHYEFGANRLYIFEGLDEVISYLEQHYELKM